MQPLNIGDAAAAAGVTPKMIRHYESLGLIPDVQRTEAGYRVYSAREVGMLRFIRQARSLGFAMKQIESLLALWRDDSRASSEVKALAQQQLAELEERQREIDEMRGTLSKLVASCKGDADPHCAILEQLSADAGQPAQPVPERAGRKNLKQVRPGSNTPAANAGPGAPAQPPAGHAGLAAWSRGLAR